MFNLPKLNLTNVTRAIVAPVVLNLASNAAQANAEPKDVQAKLLPDRTSSSVVSKGPPSFLQVLTTGIEDLNPPAGTIRLDGPLYGPSGPRAEDVQVLVKAYGDCPPSLVYMLASLAQANPQALNEIVKRQANGDYTVNFFGHALTDDRSLVLVPTTAKVSRFFPEEIASLAGRGTPTWPLVIAKAIVDEYQSTKPLMLFEDRYAAQNLTGLGVGNHTGETIGASSLDLIKAQYEAGIPMQVHTHSRNAADKIAWMEEQGGGVVPPAWQEFIPREQERAPLDAKYGIYPSQNFAVVGIGSKDGEPTIKLYDPLHSSNPIPQQPEGRLEIPFSDFAKVVLHLEPNVMRELKANQ